VTGQNNEMLQDALRDVVEHCTACGRCMANCPVKIASGEVAMTLRAFLDHEGAGGHPIKEHVLDYLRADVSKRVPKAAKLASVGQKMQNNLLGFLPQSWKERIQSPLFSGPGPKMGYTNLYESVKVQRGSIFVPDAFREEMPLALYFPGCGGALFYDRIGLSSIMLLLSAGFAVAIPPKHLCCGYPLLAAGMDVAYEDLLAEFRQYLSGYLRSLVRKKFSLAALVTSCGTCRESLSRMQLSDSFPSLVQQDVLQLVAPKLDQTLLSRAESDKRLLYHAACHVEWAGEKPADGQAKLCSSLEELTGYTLTLQGGCCAESGMGSMTSPGIYNLLRERKKKLLAEVFAEGYTGPILVGCPSCKIGIGRCLLAMQEKRPVYHVAEWVAHLIDGEDRRQSFKKKLNETRGEIRTIAMHDLSTH
ncbi:MAG: (Fe-S)-binding protein, partial [Desulfovibrio sp.]|nr:(Fe-S)-binding protein [Desulfovibrio sp.]